MELRLSERRTSLSSYPFSILSLGVFPWNNALESEPSPLLLASFTFFFPFFIFQIFHFFISLVATVVRVSFAKSNLVSSGIRATPCRNRPLVTLTFVWVSTAESFQIKNITILFFFLGFYHFLCFLVLQPDLKGLKEGNKGVSKLQTSIKCKFLTLPRLIKPQIFMGFELNSQKKSLVLFFDLNNERILQKKCGKYLFQLLRVWCHH